MEVPAMVTPIVPPNTSMSAGMLMKAGIWVPSIMALMRTHPTARPIPIAEIAFTAENLVPVVGRGGEIFGQRTFWLGRSESGETDGRAPLEHGLRDLLGRLGHDDLRSGGESHMRVGAGLDGHDQIVVQQERLFRVAES